MISVSDSMSTHAASDCFQVHLDAKPELIAALQQQSTYCKVGWLFQGKEKIDCVVF